MDGLIPAYQTKPADFPPDDQCAVIVRDVFGTVRRRLTVKAGGTIEDFAAAVELIAPNGGTVYAELSHPKHADPALFAPAAWRRVRPNGGTTVRFVLRPGEEDKDIASTIITIALIAAAVTANIVAPGFGAVLFTIGLGIVGPLILDAVAPPPTQRLGTLTGPSDAAAFERLAAITGGSNTFNPYGPIPEVFGKHRVYPPFAAKGYTEIAGENQFWRGLWAIGGPVRITDLKIGETPIDQFDDVEYVIREGRPTDPPLTLYTNDINQTDLQIELTQAAGWQARDTAADTDQISLDFQAPTGIYKIDSNGNNVEAEVRLEVQYRAAGSSDPWLPVPWLDDVKYGAGNIQAFPKPGEVVMRSSVAKTFRLSGRFNPRAKGAWSVRCRRITGDTDSNRVFDKVFWTALREIRFKNPIASLRNPATVEVRIRATGQLNQRIEQLNFIAERYVDVWTGSAFVEQLSRSPAWSALAVLRGPGTRRKVADNRIAIDEWADFATHCASNGFRFDGVFQSLSNVREAVNDILAAGRGFLWEGDRYGVVIDRPLGPPVQVFGPTNSRNYKGVRVFHELVHAFRCRFKNETVNWDVDEAIVYNDGFTEANADPNKMQAIEYFGMTEFENVFKRARFDQKQLKLRPIKHSITVDAEILGCRRGDPVQFSHDVPSIGISTGRLTALTEDGSGNVTALALTVPAEMEAGKSYGIGIRRTQGNEYLVRGVVTNAGKHRVVTLSEIILAADAPAVGDLYSFGETALETMPAIVRGVRYENADHAARVELYAAAPEIHDPGPTPPFNSFISPSARNLQPPNIDRIATDETAIVELPGGALETGAVFVLNPPGALDPKPDRYEMRFRENGAPEFSPTFTAPGDDNSPRIPGLIQARVYDLEIRSVRGTDQSRWVRASAVEIIGKRTPPPDVPALFAQQNGDKVTLAWQPVTVIDLKAYELRYGPRGDPGGFEGALFIDQRTKAEQITTTLVPPGDWTFYCVALDSAFPSNRSEVPASFDLFVQSPLSVLAGGIENPRWNGTLTGLERHWRGTLVPSSTRDAKDHTNAELFEQFVPYPVALCEYETPERIISPNDPECRLWTTQAAYLRDVLTGAVQVGPMTTGFPDVTAYLDYRLTAESYTGWQVSRGVEQVKAGAFKAKLTHQPAVNGPAVITQFSAVADIEPRSESITVDSELTWLTVNFSRPFADVPNIQLTAEWDQTLNQPIFPQYRNATAASVEIIALIANGQPVVARVTVTAEGV